VVLGYTPVGSSLVCLLNKCEISNSNILPCHDAFWCKAVWKKNIFNSDIKIFYVLSNVDRKYYQCIPKKS